MVVSAISIDRGERRRLLSTTNITSHARRFRVLMFSGLARSHLRTVVRLVVEVMHWRLNLMYILLLLADGQGG